MEREAMEADQSYNRKPKQGGKKVKGGKNRNQDDSEEDEEEESRIYNMKEMRKKKPNANELI